MSGVMGKKNNGDGYVNYFYNLPEPSNKPFFVSFGHSNMTCPHGVVIRIMNVYSGDIEGNGQLARVGTHGCSTCPLYEPMSVDDVPNFILKCRGGNPEPENVL